MTIPMVAEQTPTQTVTAPTASPLQKVRGEEYPGPDAEGSQKAAYIDRLWRYGETDALHRYKQAVFNILYVNGRQWLSWKKSRQGWEELPLPVGDFRVTMNYMLVMLRARLQRLVSSEINWRALPRDNSFHERDKARVATNFLKARFGLQEMEQKIRAGLMQASVAGFTAIKSFWNPNIGPLTPATMMFPVPVTNQQGEQVGVQYAEHPVDQNGQPVQDPSQAFQYRPGDTDTCLRTVFNIRLNPEATGWTEAEGLLWLVDSDIVTLETAREKFPQIMDQIRPMAGDEMALSYERIIAGSATRQNFLRFTTSPFAGGAQAPLSSKLCIVREYWEMKSSFFPNGRLVVIVGGAEAYDGPWPQGVFPYAPLFGDPAMMSPYGHAPANDMVPPQDLLNREYTAVAREMWASGTGKFVSWAIPGVPDQITKTDDTVVRIPMRATLMNRSVGDVFQRIPPAVVSPDRWRLIDQAKAALFDIGSYHEVSRGQIPPGLDSGVAIQYLLEQESAQLKDAVESLKRSLILWGRHQLAIAKWGYGENVARWIPVDRPDLDFSIESLKGMDLPDHETLGLDIEYFRPESESATRAEVKDLLGMGTIDPRTALKVMDLGGGFENAYQSETRHYAKAMNENLCFQKQDCQIVPMPQPQPNGQVVAVPTIVNADGSPMFLPYDDDHEIHIDVHNEIALDPTQPWPVRQLVLQHIAQHRQVMQQLVMAMQQQQAVGNVTPYTAPPPPAAALDGTTSLRRPNQAVENAHR